MKMTRLEALALLRSLPSMQVITLAHREPSIGLPKLLEHIRAAHAAGDANEAHVLSDNFITAAWKTERWLGTAERLARGLVEQQPDRHHLRSLARVIRLRGKTREAAAILRRSEQVADEHLTPEIEAAIAEAEGIGSRS